MNKVKIENYFLSLIYYKKRTVLSVLGVAIGVAILIIVLSLGKSLKAFIDSQLEAFGSDVLFVSPKPPELDEMSTIVAHAQRVKITTLKEKDLKKLKKLPYVKAVTGNVVATKWVKYRNKEKEAMVLGVYPSYKEIDKSFELLYGRMFDQRENDSLAKVAVLGFSIYQDLFKKENPIGEFIKIGNYNFKVVGVLKKRGSLGFIDLDSLVFVPTKTLSKLILGIDYFTEIDIKVVDQSKIDLVKEMIKPILRRSHHIKDPKKDDFEIASSVETIQKTTQIISIVNILLFLLALISLIVGGVGVMNMMLIAIKERTREIGLRKAAGATNKDIIFQFLIETSMVTLLGGILGIFLGVVFVLMSYFAISKFVANWQFKISYLAIFASLLFSILEGLIFGLWPAYQAGKKDPIEALRS